MANISAHGRASSSGRRVNPSVTARRPIVARFIVATSLAEAVGALGGERGKSGVSS